MSPTDRLGHRSPRANALWLIALACAATSIAGCGKYAELKAMQSFKAANEAYKRQDYAQSAEFYEKAIADNPSLAYAYFYLGNSYDNLWKPSKKGDAANDALLQKAAAGYRKAAELLPADKPESAKLKQRSLQYLEACYRADKLADPDKAEAVVEQMIQLDPSDSTNYLEMARIYEESGRAEKAEQVLLKARDARPADPAIYLGLAGLYNRQGKFDKTIAALDQRAAREPSNPEGYYTISTYFWDKVFRDKTLKEAEKRDYVQRGMTAVDRALQIKADYAEALAFKGLLLREQADLEKNPKKKQEILTEAKEFQGKAETARRKAGQPRG